MKCFVDAGNTRVKWQLRHEGRIVQSGAAGLDSSDLFASWSADQGDSVTAVHVSTVGSEAARHKLIGRLADQTPAPVRFHWTQSRFGPIRCAYQKPETLGADRWHALIGAWSRNPGASMVIDAGSAVTVDWLDDQGQHQGGYILPGRRLMLESLRQSTARVHFADSDKGRNQVPGRSTTDCVIHGLNWLLPAIGEQLGRQASVPVVLTGGDAAFIRQGLEVGLPDDVPVVLAPDLVLDGLACVEEALCAG